MTVATQVKSIEKRAGYQGRIMRLYSAVCNAPSTEAGVAVLDAAGKRDGMAAARMLYAFDIEARGIEAVKSELLNHGIDNPVVVQWLTSGLPISEADTQSLVSQVDARAQLNYLLTIDDDDLAAEAERRLSAREANQ